MIFPVPPCPPTSCLSFPMASASRRLVSLLFRNRSHLPIILPLPQGFPSSFSSSSSLPLFQSSSSSSRYGYFVRGIQIPIQKNKNNSDNDEMDSKSQLPQAESQQDEEEEEEKVVNNSATVNVNANAAGAATSASIRASSNLKTSEVVNNSAAAAAAATVSANMRASSNLKTSARHDLAMIFTCRVCETRSVKTVCKESYDKGVVVARCAGCNNLHLIADRLGWFGQPGSVEDFLAARGEEVIKGSADTLSLTLKDLAGTSTKSSSSSSSSSSSY